MFAIAYFAVRGQPGHPSPILLARLGGVVFYSFHHVGMVLDWSRLQFAGAVFSLRLTLAIALMTGTVLVLALLYWAGRLIGREAGGPAWLRGLHGTKVALPYSVITLAASYGVRFTAPRLPAPLGGVSVHPSHLAGFLWPLVLGVIAGFGGGFRSWNGTASEAGAWDRRISGAVHGGWRMIALALVFSFVALLGMAAVHPGITEDYFRGAFHNGALRGAGLVYTHALFIPNMAAWVLFPSMGTCVGVNGGPISICALSYTHFPTSGVSAGAGIPGPLGLPFTLPAFPGPPVIYFAFVAIPVLAVLLGGVAAAKRSRASTREEAVAVGAGAGVAFALFALGTLLLASIRLKAGGTFGAVSQLTSTRVGPEILSGTLLALVWGVAGGAVGGLIGGRGLARRTPAAPRWEPAGTPATQEWTGAPTAPPGPPLSADEPAPAETPARPDAPPP